MQTDKLQELRELLAESCCAEPWRLNRGQTVVSGQSHPLAEISAPAHRLTFAGKTGREGELIVAAVNALPELLAIAEAAEDLRAVCAQLREELAGWESDFDTQASHCIELMQERAAMTALLREARGWIGNTAGTAPQPSAIIARIDAALSTVAPVRESP